MFIHLLCAMSVHMVCLAWRQDWDNVMNWVPEISVRACCVLFDVLTGQ